MPETIMDRDLLLYCMAALCALGVTGMFTTHLSYRRTMRHTKDKKAGLKEKWLDIWKTRDRLLSRMNRFVWYPSLLSAALLGLAVFLNGKIQTGEGLSLSYIYLGAAIPLVLLLFRQGLDFTYREELVMNSLKDYVDHAKKRERTETAAQETSFTVDPDMLKTTRASDSVEDALQKEAMIDHIAESIRQTAAAGSHFRNMLSPEEEEIMREVIKEFMA